MQPPPPILRIGVDVGGTFTDLVAYDSAGGTVRAIKVPSTPPDYERGVAEAVNRATGGLTATRVVHGSTVATNALLQRAGGKVAVLVTEGFRDLLLIGRQNRPELYALHVQRPAPISPPECWFAVRERVGADGAVVTELSDAEIARVVGAVTAAGLRHAAVCLLFSFVTPDHERRLGRALEAAGVSVSLSCEVLPEFREYERASTTAIDASLRPTVEAYLGRLTAALPECARELRVMLSAGGTCAAEVAGRNAARMVLSGPAGGVLGAAFMSCGRDVITYDMGGTSTDVAVVVGGHPAWTTSATVDGLPLGLPVYDIHTVGAGGGSVAAVDAGGALRVGPRSAGARPGPACYGRGGTEATVTDANLVLGRIVEENFLGGAMRVDRAAAEAAVGRVAAAAGEGLIEAALGIVAVAEGNMAAALRAVSSRRGHDPRAFALMSFGGAGGLHAARLAEALEIPEVMVPPYCGVLSAFGMAVAAASVDRSAALVHVREVDDGVLGRVMGELVTAARGELGEEAERVEGFVDVRFRGQSHELRVAVDVDRPTVAEATARFVEAYARLYSRAPVGRAVELTAVRVRAVGRSPGLTLPTMSGGGRITATRLHDGQGWRETVPVADRAGVRGIGVLEGPALVVDPEATTYVPPGWAARCTDVGMLTLRRGNA